ncbi:MAG TPA: hypothetical protein VF799_10230 [Geobacteraceae bacterium]
MSVINGDSFELNIAKSMPSFAFKFKIKALPDHSRVVSEVTVSRPDKPSWKQTLTVSGMTPVPEKLKFFFGAVDINYDGHNDFFLATRQGTANSYVDYWLFVPSKQEFSYLGNYPIFTLDPKSKTLSTFERGGYGGMIFKRNRYRFIKGSLTLTESVEQVETGREGVFLRKILKIKKGKLRLVKTEMIKTPEGR